MKTGETCSICGAELIADSIDIEVGYIQVAPSECPNDCEHIEWEYKQYAKRTVDPLSMNEWLDIFIRDNVQRKFIT